MVSSEDARHLSNPRNGASRTENDIGILRDVLLRLQRRQELFLELRSHGDVEKNVAIRRHS
jgi:hypothetical protein